MISENFGFIKEENDSHLKEMIKNKNKLKEVHVDVYQENPLITSNPFMLILRTSENNATILIDNDRLIFKRDDIYETYFIDILISKITECFYKIHEDYSEYILNIQNIYYKFTIFN